MMKEQEIIDNKQPWLLWQICQRDYCEYQEHQKWICWNEDAVQLQLKVLKLQLQEKKKAQMQRKWEKELCH